MSDVFYSCHLTNPAITVSWPWRSPGHSPDDEWRVSIGTESGLSAHALHFESAQAAEAFMLWCTNGANMLDVLETGPRDVFALGQALLQRWYETGERSA